MSTAARALATALVILTLNQFSVVGPCQATPTIDQIQLQWSGRYYLPGNGPGLTLLFATRNYQLSDGTSWNSGAGTQWMYTGQPNYVWQATEYDGGKAIYYQMDTPIDANIYQITDFNFGEHSSQGTLTSTKGLILAARPGSNVATLSGYAQITSNTPTFLGESRFNYYSASVGDRVPFQIQYSLGSGGTWQMDTFQKPFEYQSSGTIDFTRPIPANAPPISYSLTGKLRLINGPDPYGIDGSSFSSTTLINDQVPDFIAPYRIDYGDESGTLKIGPIDIPVNLSFAIFRSESPNFDVMDLGYQTPNGGFIFALRFPPGSNADVPPPADYSGLPIADQSGLLFYIPNSGIENSIYAFDDVQVETHVVPEPATWVMWIVLGLVFVVSTSGKFQFHRL